MAVRFFSTRCDANAGSESTANIALSMRLTAIAAAYLLLLLPLGAAAQVGFVEVQGIQSGTASVVVSSTRWPEARRFELSEDPVLLELSPGTYSLEAHQEGFESSSHAVTVALDEVEIVRLNLLPIRTEVRLIHLLPAEVPFEVADARGVTPATVRVPVGEQLLLVDATPFCVRFTADSAAYVRIRAGALEELRGASACFRPEPPSPRGMTIPPTSRDLRGTEVQVWVLVDETGRVVADSTWLEPPTSDDGFNRRLIREAATWLFRPARQNGRPVAAWFPYRLIM